MSSEEDRISELIKALEDEKARESVIWALGKISKPALPALESTLNTTDDFNQKCFIIRALGMIGSKSVPKLVKALQKERNIWVRTAIIGTFGRMGKQAEEVIPFLLNELKNNERISLTKQFRL